MFLGNGCGVNQLGMDQSGCWESAAERGYLECTVEKFFLRATTEEDLSCGLFIAGIDYPGSHAAIVATCEAFVHFCPCFSGVYAAYQDPGRVG